MNQKDNQKYRQVAVEVHFEGVTDDRQPPDTAVYAFDQNGRFLAAAPLDDDEADLRLPEAIAGRTVKLLFGPPMESLEEADISELRRRGAHERRLRLDPDARELEFVLREPDWLRWLFCPCTVRGRVIVRVPLPDGTVQEMPVCHTRITICEVDRLPRIIWRLPDDLLFRLRDELLEAIRRPLPLPDPPTDLIDPGVIDPLPEPFRPAPGIQEMARAPRSTPAPRELTHRALTGQRAFANVRERVDAIQMSRSAAELRERLIDVSDLIIPYLCIWDWLHPFFRYDVDCLKTVMVDENGEFETTIFYPCFGDKPDLYFRAEQWQGSSWETIYAPSVACHTYWNYECGSEVTLVITDPSVIPCEPPPDIDLPSGVDTWVMPFQVGLTEIWGTLPGTPTPAPPSAGWVKPNGMTDYGGVTDAPFGGYLSFTMGHSNDIPSNDVRYYRWSYRKVGTTALKQMDETVIRHYVKQSPGDLPSFPVYELGPNTVGGKQNLFEFKPPTAPSPDPGDPAGTVTYWPTDNFFSSDRYAAFLNTNQDASEAGQYEIWLELFDKDGNLVDPAAGAFDFIVPDQVNPDQSVEARAAAPAEIKTETIGGETHKGFVFKLHIDNNQCSAIIAPPNIEGTNVADECGFLRYDPDDSKQVTLAFQATHPNGHATFSFNVHRGATHLPGASGGGEVTASSAGPYSGDGSGNFTNDFNRPALLCGPADPAECCEEAAFAENLHVRAKATRGFGSRISAYDAHDVRAFALAPEKPAP